ncbi:hypothetical protein N7495_001238 [Penicillium taxi]|uniref:uncharacterized protein n=1 Tax=Penicillium taxi TaxID=168475 RepID=UPI00254588FB|nr:uncharacterized protein N7495_001238 [Penicillium taxi]KAJ5908556.1 hypothetical protein N7495_001238 [Penicillium taxi]
MLSKMLFTYLQLATILSIAAAIPIAQDAPTTTIPDFPASSSVTKVSKLVLAPKVPLNSKYGTPVGPYSCPTKQYKRCCTSLAQTSKDILKPVGDLLPWTNGIQINSGVAFECKDMKPNEDPNSCQGHGYNPMCCTNQKSSTLNNALNACKPFERAKEEYYRTFGYGANDESQANYIMDAVTQ